MTREARRLFLSGMALFVAASAAHGLAPSGQLIAARWPRASAGAMLMPQTLSVITQIFPPERRGAAFGIWGAVASAAAVAGPTLGGLIVTHWGWQWIFHVTVPVGVVALVLAAAVVLNTCFSLQRYGRQACPFQRLPADELDQAILAGLLDTFARTDLAQQAPAPSAAKPPTPRPRGG